MEMVKEKNKFPPLLEKSLSDNKLIFHEPSKNRDHRTSGHPESEERQVSVGDAEVKHLLKGAEVY